MWISFLLFLLLLLGAVNSILPASSPEKSIFSQSRKISALPDFDLSIPIKPAVNIQGPSYTSSPEKSIHGKKKKRRTTAMLNLDRNINELASVLPLSQGPAAILVPVEELATVVQDVAKVRDVYSMQDPVGVRGITTIFLWLMMMLKMNLT